MQTIRRLCHAAVLMGICVMLMLVCSCASADESVQVTIPVKALGADCSVELLDSNHHRVQWLDLKKDTPGAFTITCEGLMRFTYKALIVNKDDDKVLYDHRVYTIHVDTYLNAQGQMAYIVSIEDPDNPSGKLAMITYLNIPQQLEPTPTPALTPTLTPEPVVTPTPSPTPELYEYKFTFTKRWSGGREDSIDWVLYDEDGSPRHKRFSKTVVSEDEWYYEGWFPDPVDDCYLIENPPAGYMVLYENVGAYSHVTDRCYPGGTIINHRIPETSDDTPLALYRMLIAVSALGLCMLGIRFRRHPARKDA